MLTINAVRFPSFCTLHSFENIRNRFCVRMRHFYLLIAALYVRYTWWGTVVTPDTSHSFLWEILYFCVLSAHFTSYFEMASRRFFVDSHMYCVHFRMRLTETDRKVRKGNAVELLFWNVRETIYLRDSLWRTTILYCSTYSESIRYALHSSDCSWTFLFASVKHAQHARCDNSEIFCVDIR